jgi:predicted GNAT superfamily acetyltransferase
MTGPDKLGAPGSRPAPATSPAGASESTRAPSAEVDAEDVAFRPLLTQDEFQACVALQRQVWGADFDECVPTAILRVAARYSGILEGAFAPPGAGDHTALVGFVFGLTGLEAGRPVHWSDMLAVAPEWRGRGLGLRLKARQRERLQAMGVSEVRWSFDPLEARNAAINLDRLGAVGRWYERDMYGASRSPLHAGIGTDRLVVRWWIGAEPSPDALPGSSGGEPVRVPIPRDLQALKARDPERARQWRLEVRQALEEPLAAGAMVAGFHDPGPRGDPSLLLYPPPTPHP